MYQDPFMNPLPLWQRAIAALIMLVTSWFITNRIDAEPEREPIEVEYPQPEFLDWEWPER